MFPGKRSPENISDNPDVIAIKCLQGNKQRARKAQRRRSPFNNMMPQLFFYNILYHSPLKKKRLKTFLCGIKLCNYSQPTKFLDSISVG